jgi:hypothetical protein
VKEGVRAVQCVIGVAVGRGACGTVVRSILRACVRVACRPPLLHPALRWRGSERDCDAWLGGCGVAVHTLCARVGFAHGMDGRVLYGCFLLCFARLRAAGRCRGHVVRSMRTRVETVVVPWLRLLRLTTLLDVKRSTPSSLVVGNGLCTNLTPPPEPA